MNKRKLGYYYLASTAAGAAVGVPAATAGAVTCTCLPSTVTKTQDPTFVKGGTSDYWADLDVDTMFGFKNANAPQVYFDWDPVSSVSNTVAVQLCRLSGTGSTISCTAITPKTSASTAHQEITVPVNGLYGTGNSIWSRYRLSVQPGNMVVDWLNKSSTIPQIESSW